MTVPVCYRMLFLVLILSTSAVCLKKINYQGYTLLRITPIDEQQLRYILKLSSDPSNGLDFWLATSSVNNPADVLIAPRVKDDILEHFKEIGMPFKILIPDIGKIIEDDLKSTVDVPAEFQFYSKYQCFDKIIKYVRDLASSLTEFTSLIEIGKSFEGRILEVLKISTTPCETKPVIWIQGGAHAREQIGPAAVIYIVEMLTSLYNECNLVKSLVDAFEWYFLPVFNPDGYTYCQTKDRLWRKTRSRHPNNKGCIGVDANRNWDIKWNSTGSSPKPCSKTYAGTKPFSEPETKAVSEYMLINLRGRIVMFVDFHSYSQRWLTPYGFTSELPPTYEEQKRLAEIGIEAVKKVNGSVYTVGSSGNHMYTVSGGARDWVSLIMSANYSYVVELRDLGEFGFLLPKRQILPNVQEIWEGIKAMATDLLRITDSDSSYSYYDIDDMILN